MKVQRYDTTFIEDYEKTLEGYMTVNVPIARPGVFPYRRGDSSLVYEAKLPQDIFSPATVDSAKAKPVTDNHPNEPVTLANYGAYAKGMSHLDSRVEDDLLKVSITITDQGLIRKIEEKQQNEISIGFLSEVIPERGEYNGDSYEYAQRNIEINHIAIVERGRAGPSVAIRNDSDAWQIENDGGNDQMATYKIDGKEYEVDSAVKSFLDAQQAKLDAADTKLKDYDALQGRADALQTKVDGLEKDLQDAQEKQISADEMDKAVEARVKLISSASSYLGDSFDFTGKADREIKEEVIKKVQSDFKADGKSDEYVNAFYDATVAKAEKEGFRSDGQNHLSTHGSSNYTADSEIGKKRQSRLNMKASK